MLHTESKQRSLLWSRLLTRIRQDKTDLRGANSRSTRNSEGCDLEDAGNESCPPLITLDLTTYNENHTSAEEVKSDGQPTLIRSYKEIGPIFEVNVKFVVR